MNVKGHVKLICKTALKCKILLICILEDQLDHMTPTGVGSRSGVNLGLHHPQTTLAGDTRSPGTTHFFFYFA